MSDYDVRSAHMHESGFAHAGRCRVRSLTATGGSNESVLDLFDTDIAPLAATYAQSGTTVTVTKVGHGLSTGDRVGISFESGTGGTAAPGNFTITVTGSGAFTFTTLNAKTITGTPACRYVAKNSDASDAQWAFTKEFAATDIYANIFDVPGRGLLFKKGVYAYMSELATADIFYEG